MALNYKLLAKAAKTAVDKRGGTEVLKQDIDSLQKIAKGDGSVGTKAGRAVRALRTAGGGTPSAPAVDEALPPTPPDAPR